MTASAIMRLLPPGVAIEAGSVLFEGRDLATADERTMRAIRGKGIAMVFQEPMTAMNPLRTIGDQIGEMFRIHDSLPARESRRGSSRCWRRCGSPTPAWPPAPIPTNSRAASASGR
jgi:peptide/nickel transport system ATP-binding protein